MQVEVRAAALDERSKYGSIVPCMQHAFKQGAIQVCLLHERLQRLRLPGRWQRLFRLQRQQLRELRAINSSISLPTPQEGENEKVNRHSGNPLGIAFLLCSIFACQDNAASGGVHPENRADCRNLQAKT